MNSKVSKMRYRKSGLALVAAVVCLLGAVGSAQVSDENAALRELTRNFFAAFQEKDLEKLLVLWSAKSPELAPFSASVKQKFAEVGKVELKSLDFRRVTVEGAESVVRVTVDLQAIDAKSGQTASGFGRVNRT